MNWKLILGKCKEVVQVLKWKITGSEFKPGLSHSGASQVSGKIFWTKKKNRDRTSFTSKMEDFPETTFSKASGKHQLIHMTYYMQTITKNIQENKYSVK